MGSKLARFLILWVHVWTPNLQGCNPKSTSAPWRVQICTLGVQRLQVQVCTLRVHRYAGANQHPNRCNLKLNLAFGVRDCALKGAGTCIVTFWECMQAGIFICTRSRLGQALIMFCPDAADTPSRNVASSRKSHVSLFFSREKAGVDRGYLVAVTGGFVAITGSMWQQR